MKPFRIIVGTVTAAFCISYALVLNDLDAWLGGFSFLAANLSLIAMSATFVLATRRPSVESLTGGLDKAYGEHRLFGIAAVVFMVLHFMTLSGGGHEEHSPEFVEVPELAPESPNEAPAAGAAEAGESDIDASENQGDAEHDDDEFEGLIELTGIVSAIAFLLLLGLSLNLRLAYERWKATHWLMAVAFVIAGAHAVFAMLDGYPFDPNQPPGILLSGTIIVGAAAAFDTLVLLPRRQRHGYVVEAIQSHPRGIDILARPVDAPLRFQAGQFAFLSVDEGPLKGEAHPFTIASSPYSSYLRFVIRSSGDFTRKLRDALRPGDHLTVQGPNGRFLPLLDDRPQLWFAAGVGLAPFLSALEGLDDAPSPEVQLFFQSRPEDRCLRESLRSAAERTEKLSAYFSADTALNDFLASIAEPERRSVYLCGPEPWAETLIEELVLRGVPRKSCHREMFHFR